MPLIRIIIRNPSHDSEGAFALSQQLESQGFQVEVASPDDAPFGPADLEIELENFSQREALDRAAELAARLHADVVVFPGALPQVAEMPVAFADPAATEVIAVPAETPPQPVMMEVPVSSEPDTPRLSFLESFGGGLKASSERAGSVLESMKRGLRHGWIVLKDAAGFAWAGLRNMASFTAGAARRRANEYREQAQNRAAQARAAREERREQMARDRAEAEQRAALVQQERMEDAARQHELQRQQHLAELERRQAEALPISSPVHDGPVAEPATVQSALPVSATSVVRPAPRVMTRKNYGRHPQLRGVLTGAVAMSVLFLVGFGLANFSPMAPLPASITQGSTQQQPSGVVLRPSEGVTLTPSGAVVLHPPAAPSVKPQPPAQSSAAPAQPGNKSKPQPRRAQRVSSGDDVDMVADDVVVRHLAPPSKKRANTPQQARLKRYSDMQ